MAGSFFAALERIKGNVALAISPAAVEQACAELHHNWREGPPDPSATLALFVQQVPAGNVPCGEVRHLAGESFTGPAWCQVKSLGRDDQLVEWFKPRGCPAWTRQQGYDTLPDSIAVREIRRTVGRVTVTIITTLLDPLRYPADDVVELRLRRWDVETNTRHLEQTMGLDVLRCESEAGVRKEPAVFCRVYNLVRVVMPEAALRQDVPASRISFIDALKRMRHARPDVPMPALVVNPWRPGRTEPRCRKRRPKKYRPMNKPRDALRKLLTTRRKSV